MGWATKAFLPLFWHAEPQSAKASSTAPRGCQKQKQYSGHGKRRQCVLGKLRRPCRAELLDQTAAVPRYCLCIWMCRTHPQAHSECRVSRGRTHDFFAQRPPDPQFFNFLRGEEGLNSYGTSPERAVRVLRGQCRALEEGKKKKRRAERANLNPNRPAGHMCKGNEGVTRVFSCEKPFLAEC